MSARLAAEEDITPSEAAPRTAERVAELVFSLTDLILAKLTQGPAVMIDRPPPPAVPKSGHRNDRPCHSKVAGQTHCLQKLERALTTVNARKTLLKCQSPRDQGSLDHARVPHLSSHPLIPHITDPHPWQ
jgi:hypothetical protein